MGTQQLGALNRTISTDRNSSGTTERTSEGQTNSRRVVSVEVEVDCDFPMVDMATPPNTRFDGGAPSNYAPHHPPQPAATNDRAAHVLPPVSSIAPNHTSRYADIITQVTTGYLTVNDNVKRLRNQQAALRRQHQILRSHLALQRSHSGFAVRGGHIASRLADLIKEQLSQAEKSHQQLVNLHYASACGSHKPEYQSLLLEHVQAQNQLRRLQGNYRGSRYKLQKLVFQLAAKHVKNTSPPPGQVHTYDCAPANGVHPPIITLHPSLIAANPSFISLQPYPPPFIASQSNLPCVIDSLPFPTHQAQPSSLPLPTHQVQSHDVIDLTPSAPGPFLRYVQLPIRPLNSQRTYSSAMQVDEPSDTPETDIQFSDTDLPPELSYPPSPKIAEGKAGDDNPPLDHPNGRGSSTDLTGAPGTSLVEVASYVRLFEKVMPDVGGERVCTICGEKVVLSQDLTSTNFQILLDHLRARHPRSLEKRVSVFV